MKEINIFFQISAVFIGVCAYMHTIFLAGEIADRFNILLLTRTSKAYLFVDF